MHYLYFLLILPLLLAAASPYPQPKSFSHATKIFKQIDFDYARTAFTDEVYSYDPTTCMDRITVQSSCFKKQSEVEFIRIVPEEMMGITRRCWHEKICINLSGKPYNGPACCRKSDERYQAYDRDIFNIIPVTKELAKAIKGYRYAEAKKGSRKLCTLLLSDEKKIVEPPLFMKGNIARVYLYMNAQYALNLSYEEQMLYLKWHALDPVDAKECAVHEQVRKLQGRTNPWIRSSCETVKSRASKSSQQ